MMAKLLILLGPMPRRAKEPKSEGCRHRRHGNSRQDGRVTIPGEGCSRDGGGRGLRD
jgi:hypothetical protein